MRSRTTRTVTVTAALVAAAAVGAGGGAATYSALGSKDGGTVVRQVTVQSASGQPARRPASRSPSARSTRRPTRASSRSRPCRASPRRSAASSRPQGQGSGFVFDVEAASSRTTTSSRAPRRSRSASGTARPTTRPSSAPTRRRTSPSSRWTRRLDRSPLEPATHPAQRRRGRGRARQPFGLEGTATSGIVSALNREMTSQNNFTISNSIQTDAAINHGNSGGPLLNAAAQVVGVNTQIKSESGGSDGIGFAIPSSTVASIVGDRLQRLGRARLPRRRRRLPLPVGRRRARRPGRGHGHRVRQGRRRPRPASRGHRIRDGRRPELPDRRRRHHRGGRHRDQRTAPNSRTQSTPSARVTRFRSPTRATASTTVQVSLGTRPS